MDELDMMSLELPSTDGLDDLDNPGTVNGNNGNISENDSADDGGPNAYNDDYSYEYEGGELEDMAVPALSEMDGSELETPAAAAAKSISLEKPGTSGNGTVGTPGLSEMSGAPAFSEMSGAAAGQSGRQGINGQYGSNSYGNSASNNMQNPQGGYGRQNTYAPVNPGSTNGGGMGQNSGSSNYWDNMEQDNELVRKGETIAKRVAMTVIVLAGLSILANLKNSDFGGAASAAIDIYFAVKFMRGSHTCRFWLGIFCVINSITSIRSYILLQNLYDIAAAFGAEIHGLGIFGVYYVIAAVGMLVLAYFFFFNKAVDAYCEKYSNRVE